MNTDTISYVILTAGVGMGVVFFALTFLSLMMVALRVTFADRSAKRSVGIGPGRGNESVASEPGPEDTDEQGTPRWVLAGAVAYLQMEQQTRAVSASPWASRSGVR